VLSVVLACGLIASVLSDVPALRLFGRPCALAMTSAVIVDMLILGKFSPQANRRSE